MLPGNNLQARINGSKRQDAISNQLAQRGGRLRKRNIGGFRGPHEQSFQAARKISGPKDVRHEQGSSKHSPLGDDLQPETIVDPDVMMQLGTLLPCRSTTTRSARATPYPPAAATTSLRDRDDEIRRLNALVNHESRLKHEWQKAYLAERKEQGRTKESIGYTGKDKALPALPQHPSPLTASGTHLQITSSVSHGELQPTCQPDGAVELPNQPQRGIKRPYVSELPGSQQLQQQRIQRRPVPRCGRSPSASGPTSHRDPLGRTQATSFAAGFSADIWNPGKTCGMDSMNTSPGMTENATPAQLSPRYFEITPRLSVPGYAFGFSELPAHAEVVEGSNMDSRASSRAASPVRFQLGMQRPIWESVPDLELKTLGTQDQVHWDNVDVEMSDI